MPNPILIEITRGPLVESAHSGALAFVRPSGEVVSCIGDIESPIFPRSAIKPLQAIPLLETGAADRFGFDMAEIAIACGSHSGTRRHITVVEGMLRRAGLDTGALACGAHEPLDVSAARELAKCGGAPSALHHNCSGKHAAMLATATRMGEQKDSYWHAEHPVQTRVARVLEDLAGCRLTTDVLGIDGCSVPNWAMPLHKLARAFACLATGEGMSASRARACRRIVEACWAKPQLVAGNGRLDTVIMEQLPEKVLVKAGAEGVYCAAFPQHGFGLALKIDDGAKRAAEALMELVIRRLYPQAAGPTASPAIKNWRGFETGRIQGAKPIHHVLSDFKSGA